MTYPDPHWTYSTFIHKSWPHHFRMPPAAAPVHRTVGVSTAEAQLSLRHALPRTLVVWEVGYTGWLFQIGNGLIEYNRFPISGWGIIQKLKCFRLRIRICWVLRKPPWSLKTAIFTSDLDKGFLGLKKVTSGHLLNGGFQGSRRRLEI